jgi:hypothetical protein
MQMPWRWPNRSAHRADLLRCRREPDLAGNPMPFSVCRFALFLIAAGAISTGAAAQNSPVPSTGTPPATPACPAAKTLKAPQVYGLWSVRFTNPPAGLPATATLLLEKHAEFSESLAGMVSRDLGTAAGSAAIAGHAPRAALAGDLDEGILVLDESSNNINITGTWNGEVVEGSCGKQVRGVWKDTSNSAPANASDIPFVMNRLP